MQNGQVMTLIQGSFGAPRESMITFSAEAAPVLKPVEQCPELPFASGVMPDYLRFMDIRWALGGMPFSNTPSPAIGGYVRFRGEPHATPMSEAHILALVDTWPPAVLPHLDKPAPGSSLTWTIEFIQPQPSLDTLQWCSLSRSHRACPRWLRSYRRGIVEPRRRADRDQSPDGYRVWLTGNRIKVCERPVRRSGAESPAPPPNQSHRLQPMKGFRKTGR